ncbi:hypothetical protein R3P38DRAFT_3189353 [Favolaschia claudopus]|uniref:Uncharacterized protein n=1 Tax=Favolaschia claudopus TaxID=2862362 RepID=A0AAW0BSH4_9AGAR
MPSNGEDGLRGEFEQPVLLLQSEIIGCALIGAEPSSDRLNPGARILASRLVKRVYNRCMLWISSTADCNEAECPAATQLYIKLSKVGIVVGFESIRRLKAFERAHYRLQAVEAVRKLPATTLSFSAILTYDHLTRSTSAEDDSYTSAPSPSREAPIQDAFDRRAPSKVTHKHAVDVEVEVKEKTSKESSVTRLKNPGELIGCSTVSRRAIPPTTRPTTSIVSPESEVPAYRIHRRSPAAPHASSSFSHLSRSSTFPNVGVDTDIWHISRLVTADSESTAHSRLYVVTTTYRAPFPPNYHLPLLPATVSPPTRASFSPKSALYGVSAPSRQDSSTISAAVQPPASSFDAAATIAAAPVSRIPHLSSLQQTSPACRSAVGAPPPRPDLRCLDVPPPSTLAAVLIPANVALRPVALPHRHLTPCRARVEKSPPRYRLSGRGHRSSSPPPLSRCGSVEIRPTSPSVRKTGKDPPWRIDADPSNAARSRGRYHVFRASALARSTTPPPTC